jgi:sugar lactone lactonase YvrE
MDTLASELWIASKIVMDSDYLYWAEEDTVVPYYVDATTGRIRKVSKDGGNVTTMVAGLNHPIAVIVDDSNIYFIERGSWTNSNGMLKKIPKSGGVVTTLATGLNYPQGPVALDAGSVYWQEPTSEIHAISKNGGSGVTLYTGSSYWSLYPIAADMTSLFWTEFNDDYYTRVLRSMPSLGGSAVTLDTGLVGIGDIKLSSSSVFWTEGGSYPFGNPLPGAGSLKMVAKSGGAVTVLASGLNTPAGIALDTATGFVYWADVGTWTGEVYDTNTSSIKRISADGGEVLTLVSGLGGADLIQVDQKDLYWSESQRPGAGVIKRMSLDLRSPWLVSVEDVPHDQGGKVTLRWQATSLDTNIAALPYYSIWRAVPASRTPKDQASFTRSIAEAFNGEAYRTTSIDGTLHYWEWVANQPAHKFSAYSFSVPTLSDSMSTTTGYEYFLVSAHTSDPNVFYDSNIDSGYSIDNLRPLPPQNVTNVRTPGMNFLSWNSNHEMDLKQYVIYRGSTDHVDSLMQVGATTDTVFVISEELEGKSYWSVVAEDIHENRSQTSIAVMVTDVKDNIGGLPSAFDLYQNYPNPFNPSTTLQYSLPIESRVKIVVRNILGQDIATLINAVESAGYRQIEWNASRIGSGIYFYTLEATGISDPSMTFTKVKKMMLLK